MKKIMFIFFFGVLGVIAAHSEVYCVGNDTSGNVRGIGTGENVSFKTGLTKLCFANDQDMQNYISGHPGPRLKFQKALLKNKLNAAVSLNEISMNDEQTILNGEN